MNILVRWFLAGLSIMLVGWLVPGIHIDGLWAALLAALVLGILNAIVRPLLILLTLPITILTLGLFTLIINAGVFILASTIVKGFTVDGFGAAIIGSILLWLVNWALVTIFDPKKKPSVA